MLQHEVVRVCERLVRGQGRASWPAVWLLGTQPALAKVGRGGQHLRAGTATQVSIEDRRFRIVEGEGTGKRGKGDGAHTAGGAAGLQMHAMQYIVQIM